MKRLKIHVIFGNMTYLDGKTTCNNVTDIIAMIGKTEISCNDKTAMIIMR